MAISKLPESDESEENGEAVTAPVEGAAPTAEASAPAAAEATAEAAAPVEATGEAAAPAEAPAESAPATDGNGSTGGEEPTQG